MRGQYGLRDGNATMVEARPTERGASASVRVEGEGTSRCWRLLAAAERCEHLRSLRGGSGAAARAEAYLGRRWRVTTLRWCGVEAKVSGNLTHLPLKSSSREGGVGAVAETLKPRGRPGVTPIGMRVRARTGPFCTLRTGLRSRASSEAPRP